MIKIGPQNDDRSTTETINDIKYIFTHSDPHGMITVTCKANNKNLEGYFTSKTEAIKAATRHSLTLKKKVD